MPHVIFKCPYIRGGSGSAAAHLSHYTHYIATRRGAERITSGRDDLLATKKQTKLVAQILRDFPLSRGMFEYKDYLASPTRGNATEFITRALEDNSDQLAKKENYVQYISQRPRAERLGDHALFTGLGDALVLSHVVEKVSTHPGHVWLPIISLRREDAQRLGYDNADQWRAFLSSYAVEMAKAMNIPLDQFRWYAAYHDEGHHPHIHMVCYSEDAKHGYLTKEGIAEIKAGLAKRLFRDELTSLYARQTERRDELVQEAGTALVRLIREMESGTLESPRMEQLMGELAGKLKHLSGKKQYGYLKAPMKSLVDEIVDELSKDPRVAAAYDLWYTLREEVLRTYREDMPERLPLSQQKGFKRIKNIVIEEAVRLGMLDDLLQMDEPEDVADSFEHPGVRTWFEKDARMGNPNARYSLAKLILDDPTAGVDQIASAVDWLKKAAEAGQDAAQYAIGKFYRDTDPAKAAVWFQRAAESGNDFAAYAIGKLLLDGGDGLPKDVTAAMQWLTRSAEQGSQYAQYTLGKLYLLGKDVPKNEDAAVRWFTLSAAQGNEYAQYFLEHLKDFRGPSLFSCATQLLRHMGNIFREQTSWNVGKGVAITDRKLRQRIREKKIAMGHKPDDHAQEMTM